MVTVTYFFIVCLYLISSFYVFTAPCFIIVCHHYHHVAPSARISLILSRHLFYRVFLPASLQGYLPPYFVFVCLYRTLFHHCMSLPYFIIVFTKPYLIIVCLYPALFHQSVFPYFIVVFLYCTLFRHYISLHYFIIVSVSFFIIMSLNSFFIVCLNHTLFHHCMSLSHHCMFLLHLNSSFNNFTLFHHYMSSPHIIHQLCL